MKEMQKEAQKQLIFVQAEAKKPFQKQKESVQNFANAHCSMTACSNEGKALVFADATPIMPKVEFNFEVIIYITVFVSKVGKAVLNLQSVFESYLKALRSNRHVFIVVVGRKNSSPEKKLNHNIYLDLPPEAA